MHSEKRASGSCDQASSEKHHEHQRTQRLGRPDHGLTEGPVNAQAELTTPGGDRIVAVLTREGLQSLGLELGSEATAYVKAPWVMLLTGGGEVRFSARNQLSGIVRSVMRGQVNAEVSLELPGGTTVCAVITNEAVMELGLREGVPATALIKASHVVLGVAA